MARAASRRRQFFVKKEFQGKFILLYAVVIIGLAGFITFMLFQNGQDVLTRNLYVSHLKVQSTGEILFGLLFKTNVFALLAIVLLVIVLSFIVFSRLNAHFFHMEQRLEAMAQGDFTSLPQPASHFNEISRLISMVQSAQTDYRQRFEGIAEALETIEGFCHGQGDPGLLIEGNEKLKMVLNGISLPDRHHEPMDVY
jgi:methyl-accepting chemotaxis protein